MNNPYLAPSMALASLFALAFPAQAQTPPGMEMFNPMTILAPIMTPLGAMLVPMTAPMNNPANAFNPATMFNPALFNPAMLSAMPTLPGYPAPTGMTPFSGLQAAPQAYGMPPQMMANPFVGAPPQMANPFAGLLPYLMPAQPAQPNQAAYPMFPGIPNFPMPFPGVR
ncbi:MAG: hypothetical protein PHD37_05290 [Gallionellaceae bacterium]|nr:hypothetical protein [Gallionellaceae bacterium]